MVFLAVSTTVTVLALIGLVVGVVVLVVVVGLLQGVLSPLRAVLADVKDAQTAPMLERGIPGTDQLSQTRRLADSVPDLAMAYLQKLSLGGARPPAAPAPAAPAPSPGGYAPPPPPPPYAPPPPSPPSGEQPAVGEILRPAEEPAWKRFR